MSETALELHARKMTKALTGLTANGSEFFVRVGESYYADTEKCVEYVRTRQADQHQMIINLSLENKANQALIADLAEALRPFAEAAINLDEVAEDKSDIWECAAAYDITAGDLRKAAAVLARVPK